MTYEEILLIAIRFAGHREDLLPGTDVIEHLRDAHAKALRTVFSTMDEATALQISKAAVKGLEDDIEIDIDVFAGAIDRWIRRNTKEMLS
jgi:hypothetical protein